MFFSDQIMFWCDFSQTEESRGINKQRTVSTIYTQSIHKVSWLFLTLSLMHYSE